ncbi:CBO0543 family protein [Neobacillus cucumis]|uniref:CBO0543 family protein n=1 Tax=Neobacillus cucumis TaxID=1740721 RepID=UPI0028534219|nr:CBO0543 family protein [Neobacillus cucumis]MDR4948098.1 CBO0543 family protein [Neobacillus cucumis]
MKVHLKELGNNITNDKNKERSVQMTKKMLLFKDVQDKRMDFIKSFHEYWINNDLFSWQWWFLLLTTILTWIVWVKTVDKKRTHLILNYGLFFGIFSFVFDMIGVNHGAWAYPIRLYWAFIPPLLPFDLTYLPVIFMVTYQRYGQRWFSFILALIVISAVISLLIEPLFHWMGIYVMYKWKYIYSFPLYILLASFVKFLVELINKKLL